MNAEDPAQSLVQTLAESDLTSIAGDAAELTLDAFLKDGILRDIPVVNSIVGLAKGYLAVRDYLFMRKLLSFLCGISDIPPAQRQRLLGELKEGSKQERKLGETLLLLLDRLDDVGKAEILSWFFRAYLEGSIDHIKFRRLSRALDRFNLALLPHLKQYYREGGEAIEISEDIEQELSAAGLVGMHLGGGAVGSGSNYMRTTLGEEFVRLVAEWEARKSTG